MADEKTTKDSEGASDPSPNSGKAECGGTSTSSSGGVVQSYDLKMWSAPGWDHIREASKTFDDGTKD